MTILDAGTQLIETERLILWRFTQVDATDMFNNWINDKEVQSNYGESIVINYRDSMIGKAKYYIKTDDLTDILQFMR